MLFVLTMSSFFSHFLLNIVLFFVIFLIKRTWKPDKEGEIYESYKIQSLSLCQLDEFYATLIALSKETKHNTPYLYETHFFHNYDEVPFNFTIKLYMEH